MNARQWYLVWAVWVVAGLSVTWFNIEALRHWLFVIIYIIGNGGLLTIHFRKEKQELKAIMDRLGES